MEDLYYEQPTPLEDDTRYADGEEVIAGGSDAADCIRKLLALEQRHGEAVSITDVSDDCYERGRYIGKETHENLV